MKWGKLVKESRIQFQENGKKVFFSLIGKLHIYRKKLKNDQITNRVKSKYSLHRFLEKKNDAKLNLQKKADIKFSILVFYTKCLLISVTDF